MEEHRIEYKLNFDDFLENQLYGASQSKTSIRKRKNVRFIVPLVYLGIGAYLTIRDEDILGILIFATLGVLWIGLYPVYSRRKYKKHYQKHIAEHYQKRVDKTANLNFDSEFIYSKNETSEGKIKLSEVDNLVELKEHFLVKLKNDTCLILPKRYLNEPTWLKQLMIDSNINYINEVDWVWK